MHYLTISSLAMNLYLAAAGNNQFEVGKEDMNLNRSKCEKQMAKMMT